VEGAAVVGQIIIATTCGVYLKTEDYYEKNISAEKSKPREKMRISCTQQKRKRPQSLSSTPPQRPREACSLINKALKVTYIVTFLCIRKNFKKKREKIRNKK
jgi:hypothetical protein